MLPRALLFSSDEPTVTVVREVLTNLQVEVVHSHEIFDAVEKLTTRNFQAILIDWAQELEASFLFNMARELKSTKDIYSLVIVDARLAPVLTITPDAFLEKPFTAEQVRGAILSALTGRTPPKGPATAGAPVWFDTSVPVEAPKEVAAMLPETEQHAYGDWGAVLQPQPKLVSGRLELDGTRTSRLARRPLLHAERSSSKKAAALVCLLALLATVVHAEKELGYLPGNSYRSLTEFLLAPSKDAAIPTVNDTLALEAATEFDTDNGNDRSGSNYFSKTSGHPAVRPIFREGYSTPSRPTQSIAQNSDMEMTQPLTGIMMSSTKPLIPSSLYLSPPRIAMFQGLPRMTVIPGSWTGEPILVPEEMSRSMLIREVAPNYPLEALRAGLQGPVVFQALVGRDGTIEDLKLVHGYFALGLAAVDAVRLWRFRPYRVNGEIVEMRTFLTITFPATNELGKTNSNGSLITYGAWR